MDGALAQLGAHNTGSVGVTGSNPVRSTNQKGVLSALLFGLVDILVLRNHVRTKCARGEFAKQICASIVLQSRLGSESRTLHQPKRSAFGTPFWFGRHIGFEKPCAHKVRSRRICVANLRRDSRLRLSRLGSESRTLHQKTKRGMQCTPLYFFTVYHPKVQNQTF